FQKGLSSLPSNSSVRFPDCVFWRRLTDSDFNINDTFTLEFDIRMIHRESWVSAGPGKFAAPNIMSNVILKIGEEK
ncbi:hypothetical protein PMAYCL1PPCAC_25610, partial [Pristionchus mayeri]